MCVCVCVCVCVDIIKKDLNDLNMSESCWYELGNISRSVWRDQYHVCLESSQVSSGNVDLHTVVCPECHTVSDALVS